MTTRLASSTCCDTRWWAQRAVGPTPEHDPVLAELLTELRQTVSDVRTIDQLGSDRVQLRRRQAELERRIRDRARIAPPAVVDARSTRSRRSPTMMSTASSRCRSPTTNWSR